MSQKGLLIEKIIETTQITDCKPTWTPMTQVALGSNPKRELFNQANWNYASVVGMLLYILNNT